MITEELKPLPQGVELTCYVCQKAAAVHLGCYKIDEMVVQVYLCDNCVKIDTRSLLEHTVGIQMSL